LMVETETPKVLATCALGIPRSTAASTLSLRSFEYALMPALSHGFNTQASRCWYAKVFAALVVGYVLSPIDPIPDFIPGVELLDEMVVVPIGVLIAAKMIPCQVMEECQEKAREVAEGEKPVSRVAAVVVVAIWLLCVALAVPATTRSKPMKGRGFGIVYC
jgi:uncharacterized membrane protein YkvA (DUF1232 family)